jgi:hypothetical protein
MNYQFIPLPFNFYGVWYSPQVIVTMARPTFKEYMDSIQIKSGKTAQDFRKLASKKGFVRHGKVISKHSEMLARLKSREIGLGHVHANFHYTVSAIACK